MFKKPKNDHVFFCHCRPSKQMFCNNADQLSTDKVPMDGFNMGKGGAMWPLSDSATDGAFGKNKNPTVDGLNILWKNMAIHLKCHTMHGNKFQ